MVLQLTSNQITSYWDGIKEAMRVSLAPTAQGTPEALNEVLQELLSGGMQAWAAIENDQVYALAVTAIQIEIGSKERNLLIYALYGYITIPEALWEEGMQAIHDFARGQQCKKILAYSKVPRILEVASNLGAQTDFHLIEWEV